MPSMFMCEEHVHYDNIVMVVTVMTSSPQQYWCHRISDDGAVSYYTTFSTFASCVSEWNAELEDENEEEERYIRVLHNRLKREEFLKVKLCDLLSGVIHHHTLLILLDKPQWTATWYAGTRWPSSSDSTWYAGRTTSTATQRYWLLWMFKSLQSKYYWYHYCTCSTQLMDYCHRNVGIYIWIGKRRDYKEL